MLRWTLLLLAFSLSCQSKTNKKTSESRSPMAAEKVTAAPPVPTAEVFAKVEFGPRRPQEIELGLINGFKACLLTHMATQAAPLILSVEGQISYQGGVQDAKFEGVEAPLKECLNAAISSIKLGRGKIGPFKMAIATGPELLKGAKGMVISPAELKKFE